MKRPAYYLCGSSNGWELYPLGHGESCVKPAPLASALDARGVCRLIAERTDTKQRQAGVQIVIGLPASWCLCATVSDAGIPSGTTAQTEQALHYRLEAALPITAEDYAIALMGSGPEYLGVATQADRLKALVHQLEDEGHTVVSITPRAFLTAQAWCAEKSVKVNDRPTTLCWVESDGDGPGSMQLLHLDSSRPPRWRMIDCSTASILDDADLPAQLAIDEMGESASGRHWLIEQGITDRFDFLKQDGAAIEGVDNPFNAECVATQAIAERNETAWANLCSGPLAQRYQWRRVRVPALSAIAAAMLLLATIMSILFIQAEQYDQIADQVDTQMAEVFTEALPGQPVPTSPLRRLQTRLKQLRGESGMAGGDQLQDRSAPMLAVLYDLLTALPADQRFAVTDLRLEDGGLRMNGYARSHSEADQLANTLRQAGIFIVEPPSTDKLPDGGVRFSLEARHAGLDVDRDTPPSTGPEDMPKSPSLADRSDRGAGR